MIKTGIYFDIVNYVICLSFFICCFVAIVLMFMCFFIKGVFETPSENSMLEFFWTMIPSFFVLLLCLLKVNFVMKDLQVLTKKTIKITGHQWYWKYEYKNLSYDSYMLGLVNNVSKPLQFLYGVPTRLLITSSDVIHSFSIPDLNMKLDAMPGRMNQLIFSPDRMGVFSGYCSELCGAGHSYMPIVVEVMISKVC